MEAKVEDFLLPAANEQDDITFRSSIRKQALVTPLVDAVATFQAMEEAIAGAQKSVHLAVWLFNPDTPLQSRNARKSGASTWAHLLRMQAAKGVEVRILLTDFDPILQNNLHRSTWSAYRRLIIEALRIGASDRDLLQVICSLHSATIRVGAEDILRGPLNEIVRNLNALVKNKKQGIGVAKQHFRDMPGMWMYVEYVEKTNKFQVVKRPDFTIHPACHHQKICLVDGTIAFCGGLDVNTGRIDTSKHTGNLWHDIHCKVEGGPAGDIERNFFARWNREEPGFKAFVESANSTQRLFKIQTLDTSLISEAPASVTATPGQAFVQMHRTLSVDSPLSKVPDNLLHDIEEVYEKAIGRANSFIYVENQYVRASQLADWLINRKAAVPDLQVIIVLPVAPEELAQEGGADRLTLHGLFLQHELLTRLKGELSKNLGLYSMVKRAKADDPSHKTNYCGSTQIYVHSKCLIVDDLFASIGSANTNSRGFWIDTELAIGWFEPSAVAQFRKNLWNELLGSPKDLSKWAVKDYVKEWDTIANANAKTQPSKRNGFVVPHDTEKFQGTQDSQLLDPFAELINIDPNRKEETAIA